MLRTAISDDAPVVYCAVSGEPDGLFFDAVLDGQLPLGLAVFEFLSDFAKLGGAQMLELRVGFVSGHACSPVVVLDLVDLRTVPARWH
jgi:hypothetical protein